MAIFINFNVMLNCYNIIADYITSVKLWMANSCIAFEHIEQVQIEIWSYISILFRNMYNVTHGM